MLSATDLFLHRCTWKHVLPYFDHILPSFNLSSLPPFRRSASFHKVMVQNMRWTESLHLAPPLIAFPKPKSWLAARNYTPYMLLLHGWCHGGSLSLSPPSFVTIFGPRRQKFIISLHASVTYFQSSCFLTGSIVTNSSCCVCVCVRFHDHIIFRFVFVFVSVSDDHVCEYLCMPKCKLLISSTLWHHTIHTFWELQMCDKWLQNVGFGHAHLTKTFDNKKSQSPSSSPERCDNVALTPWDLVDVSHLQRTRRAHRIWTAMHGLHEMMSTMAFMLHVVGCGKMIWVPYNI
jgi:hypothetical protein